MEKKIQFRKEAVKLVAAAAMSVVAAAALGAADADDWMSNIRPPQDVFQRGHVAGRDGACGRSGQGRARRAPSPLRPLVGK